MSDSGVRDSQGHVGANTWVLPYEDSGEIADVPITDLSWSRFGSLVSLRSKFRPSQPEGRAKGRKHLDILEWLKVLDLEEYEKLFSSYNGVEELLDVGESDIKALGVKIASHRARIMSSLTALKAKYDGGTNNRFSRKEASLRHSLAVDNRKKIQQEDTISDLKTVSEAIQSKSLNNLIMEPCMDPTMDAAALKKALEWELSLDARDLRSHAWYHGAIPRSRAEDIVKDEEGSFLVRDCTSQPGDFVLSCRSRSHPLHFVINKAVLHPDTVYERMQYRFEDDAFDTVPDLITFYVGSGKPITAASAARIQFPKNRMYPLSFYASKFPPPLSHSRMSSPATTPMLNVHLRPNPSPTRISVRDGPPRLPSKKQRSHSLTPAEVNRIAQEKCNSADGCIQPLMTRSAGPEGVPASFSTHSLPRTPCAKLSLSPSTLTLGRNGRNMSRVTSDPSLSPCAERRLIAGEEEEAAAPPKPSRVPSLIRTESRDSDVGEKVGKSHLSDGGGAAHGGLQRVTSYHASGSDSGNGSGDSALSSAAGDAIDCPQSRTSGVVIKNPRYHLSTSESTTTLKNFDFCYKEAEDQVLQAEQPKLPLCSRFDLENFQTILLPVNDNKPLDSQALKGVKLILKETGPRILANHLTSADMDVVFGDNLGQEFQKFGNGIELCALPYGHQFRLDLIERTECMKLLVAVTILTCPDETDRTEMLNKWIEVAIDTKTALGNLYGFNAIMMGLCLPQIQKLDATWHQLRQKHTDTAFTFEAKLRPTLTNMNNCSNPQAPNTTIPHLLPFLLLHERDLHEFQHGPPPLWENNTHDFGLGALLAHLQATRKFFESIAMFKRNSEIVLEEARMEDLTLDAFKTEFHLKFLWGSRGACAPTHERLEKFEQVLDVMAAKYCAEA